MSKTYIHLEVGGEEEARLRADPEAYAAEFEADLNAYLRARGRPGDSVKVDLDMLLDLNGLRKGSEP